MGARDDLSLRMSRDPYNPRVSGLGQLEFELSHLTRMVCEHIDKTEERLRSLGFIEDNEWRPLRLRGQWPWNPRGHVYSIEVKRGEAISCGRLMDRYDSFGIPFGFALFTGTGGFDLVEDDEWRPCQKEEP